jgi:peptidyl-prolyl cis-trans isomerase SurA
MRKELTLSLLRQRDVLQRISVTPHEIDQYLEKQKNTPSAASEYNVSHILIAVPQAATANELDAASKKADEVYQKAKSGEDFAKLAVAYSNSQDALDGGALNWRKGTELPTFLTDVVLKLKPGEVAEPLRTPTGFHIVKLNEMRGANQQVMVNQVHVRHILMKTNELADDATVRQKLTDLRARILKGEDFAGLAHTIVGGSGLGFGRGRSRLGGPRQLRARIRAGRRGTQGKRDQRALQDPVRLAHRAGARQARVRQHRRVEAQARGRGDSREQSGRRDGAVAATSAR